MWEKLGIDLEAHDTLMQVLGQGYKDVYHSQEGRPEGMKYFDFVITEVHGLRIKELVDAQAEGRKVVGTFCVFVPEELVLAVDGICVGLCAGAPWALEEAERYLPRNTCSLIKGFFGFQLGKVCPYLMASDVIVGENTCDGKKKAYEIFADHVDDMYVMDMPQTKSEEGRAVLASAYRNFVGKLEDVSGRTITVDSLRKGIQVVNDKRRALHRLSRLRAADPAPISGLDALLATQISFYDDPPRFTDSLGKICDELEKRIENGRGVRPAGAPRILMSGCPMAIPNWKVPHIVESSTKAVIVGEESCVGERGTRNLTDDAGESVEALLENTVERYFQIDCAVFTPNPERLEHVRQMARDLKADGVIHYGLQFCHPYQIEAGPVERALEEDGIPTLRIDTDYSQEDVEQIRTRVEAFVERLEG
jgi:benzoyl-CoA reductase/2-hydroxyglutaryl-CoA dehydratase subunit BcrC/BadD/HgdB